MKKIFLLIAICGFIFSSCGNTTNKDTHAHDDGTVHEAHEETGNSAKPAQESFEVTKEDTSTPETDSLSRKKESHSHDHGDGKAHTH